MFESVFTSGTLKVEVNETAEYYRRERFDGEFRCVITLPGDVDSERVAANTATAASPHGLGRSP
jgi:HSP20 family molecular chaperone IbpA